jgi:uncharacterized protein
MEFEWDATKDAANRAKHGVSLADAARLDWQIGRTEVDPRQYGELRLMRYAKLDGRLMVCIYTLRGTTYRIISLRKANQREIRDYGTT